ncbi:MAG TPA: hypothetical protein VMQ58_01525, partial [Candidatus Saccharimonadales bacterium]|nr:hypothetical protein [Candidatus Saccharimonadales bacterium]
MNIRNLTKERVNILKISSIVGVLAILLIISHFTYHASGLGITNSGNAKLPVAFIQGSSTANLSSASNKNNNSKQTKSTAGSTLYQLASANIKSSVKQVSSAKRSSGSRGSSGHSYPPAPVKPIVPVPPTNPAPPVVPTPPANTPEPASFSWDGYSWDRRSWGGSPAYNGLWSTSNVIGPNSSNQMTLQVTNPSGNSPYSAEFDSQKEVPP